MFFTVKSVCKSYGTKQILRNISFDVERGSVVTIIGPSGVGKTTLLKIIGGLEKPTSGSIGYESEPTLENPIILVFQDFILFPNMTVFDNVAFGLKARRYDFREIDRRVSEMLAYFGIDDKRESYPNSLSAGQQQRTAIARAMVVNPSVLLLDEPFAHLDKNLRLETAEFIRSTQKSFGVTTVSVTHDLQEAFAMSDRIGVMLDGRLRQYDTVEKVYFAPNTLEVAQFLGPVNEIPRTAFDALGVDGNFGNRPEVYVRAEAFTIERADDGPGLVVDVCFVGVLILYRVKVGDRDYAVYSLNDGIAEGDRVRIRVSRHITTEENDK
jgi:putative spermidine/putrescine transport system ATP-binding protein